MPGTHYTLDREKDDNKNPMDRIKEKACRTCGTVKPNTFQFFGKKLWKTRVNLTTNEVCIACQKAKTSASMKAKWAARKQESAEYDEEQIRMAQAQFNNQELVKAQQVADTLSSQVKAVEPLQLDIDEAPEIKPISLEESTVYVGSVVPAEPEIVIENHTDEVRKSVDHVETDSERLMRELLSKT